ncbi:ParA family protein [Paracoccus seriniphilus]|uniref:Chromosome partitioning protein ParA n=1 Tax=Paracoccus seriniphilus TaxID=184748 RepID=A0A239PXE3_9RHOB|nr:AAA family ATPase [Paracoccus seriniphilus]WCR14087.1 ParA family protein [Paracoccus seriniphilus]SNT74989.1 chromosome segregation ATPase [Paracoccus seriniphilus]
MSDTRIVAIANQKGGVGKTTTAINLGAALASQGYRTILVDLDPQGNASTGLGIEVDRRERTVYDLLAGDETLEDCAMETEIANLRVVPATSDLASADVQLAQFEGRSILLKRKLVEAEPETIILIDCPPALGLLTLNAIIAADSVLVPLQTEFYALEGLSQLLATVQQVRKNANPDLRVNGILLTMSDYRNNLSQHVEADVREQLGELVYQTVIPRNVRVSEAPSFGQPVLVYDPSSKGSMSYLKFAEEFAARTKLAREVA